MRGEGERRLLWEDESWDAVVRGEPIPEPIDPVLAETIARVHRLDDASAPRPDFVARLRDELTASTVASLPLAPMTEVKPISANGHLRPVRLPLPLPGSRRSVDVPLVYAIAAALLVAIVGGIIGALLTDRLMSDDRPQPPAILAPDTLTPTDETLVELTLPAELIPQGSERGSGLSLDAYRPQSESVWEPYCCDGPVVQYQLTGAIQVTADAPFQILRADGQLEEIPAATEATVTAGDTLITLNQTGLTTANRGTAPAEVLNWTLHESPGNVFGGRRGQAGLTGGHYRTVGDVAGNLIPLPGAVTMTLSRLILEPDRVVPAEADRVMLPVQRDPTTEVILFRDDGSFTAATVSGEPTPIVVYLAAFGPAGEGGAPSP